MKDLYPILLGGRKKETDEKMPVINPYSGATAATVCLASYDDVRDAISLADRAAVVMAALPSYRRADILQKVSDLIRERRDEFSRTITIENGKPISESRGETERAALTFRIASEEAVRTGGEVIPLDRNRLSEGRWGIVRRFPCGTVFGITPFNFPLNLVAHKIAPAIAAGNPIVLKPASKTPVTALMLGDLLVEAGVPDGGISIIPCAGRTAEEAVADPRVKVLSFTGSASVGWRLKKTAYDKRVLLELGGNAGVVIDRECDLEYAVSRCVAGSFSYAGQVCISVQRIYVHREVHDMFLGRFVGQVRALRLGDPLDEATKVGPMIDEDNLERVRLWLNEAIAAGARVLTGGKRQGNFFEPTVILDATPEMKVSCMEVFAPVVTVAPVDSFEAGLRAVNDSAYGLQAGIFTNSLTNAFRAFETLAVGGVIVNDVPAYRADHMPYGGVKQSGFGREGIRYAIEEMTEVRLMAVNPR